MTDDELNDTHDWMHSQVRMVNPQLQSCRCNFIGLHQLNQLSVCNDRLFEITIFARFLPYSGPEVDEVAIGKYTKL